MHETMSVAAILEEQKAGRVRLVDLAAPPRFAQGHPAGALNLPFGPAFGQALAAVPSDLPLVVFAEQAAVAERAIQSLLAAGRMVRGSYARGLEAWQAEGGKREGVAQMTVDELASRLEAGLGEVAVVDVREPYEWRSGVIPGARLISMGSVPDRLHELDREQPVAIVCARGVRSAQVAAWLGQQGFEQLHNVPGGMALWLGAGRPVAPPLA